MAITCNALSVFIPVTSVTSIYKLHHSPIRADAPVPLFASIDFFSSLHKIMVLTDSFPCMILHRRNLACRGCGCPRSENQVSMNRQALGMSTVPRLPTSPRFAGNASPAPLFTGSPIPNPYYAALQPGARHAPAAQSASGGKPASPSHPLLTPSGRSFSVGGKVQNISSDPCTPCIMYWPDNEPFPEQGQIRPNALAGIPVSHGRSYSISSIVHW